MVLTNALVACCAASLEAAFGYPPALYTAIGHPVTWMGAWLARLEARLNVAGAGFARRRLMGFAAFALYLAPIAVLVLLLQTLSAAAFIAPILVILVAASLPAQRSLHAHVKTVADALAGGDPLDEGRRAVAMIVGRDVAALDEAAIARAAIESLAENFSDGVVAPLLWTAAFGLFGGALYKAINTADSMIGHRNARYEAFGYAAAKLDDLANAPPSRLSVFLIAAAAGRRWREALDTALHDAPHHRSPNAGWPEAAMAGALGLKLAGPRLYGGVKVDDAFMGDGRAEATAEDVYRALALYRRACWANGAMLVAWALAAAVA